MIANVSTVVAGYDGSPAAAAAARWGAAQLPAGGTLWIVTAYEPPPDWAGTPVAQPLLDERRREAERRMAELLEELAEAGVEDVGTELMAESPARAIAAVAATRRADLVVVGSHGRSLLGTAVLGSVTRDLLTTLDCPLLVITDHCAHRMASEARAAVA